MNASGSVGKTSFLTQLAFMLAGTASLVAVAAAWGTTCYTTQQRNCCSVITGGPQKRSCGGVPCDDLIWNNTVFTQAFTASSGNTDRANNPVTPSPQCQWEVRYCDQNGVCMYVGGGLLTIGCTNEKLAGQSGCVVNP